MDARSASPGVRSTPPCLPPLRGLSSGSLAALLEQGRCKLAKLSGRAVVRPSVGQLQCSEIDRPPDPHFAAIFLSTLTGSLFQTGFRQIGSKATLEIRCLVCVSMSRESEGGKDRREDE